MQEETDQKKALEKFMAFMNQNPPETEVFENKHAGNTKYLPISFLEMNLDELFFGLWETKDFKTSVIGNEVVGSITLRVFHPIAQIWIERTGAAATMIRTAKDMPTTAENKIKNALEMDYPHLLADCFRNACLHFGKRFGRDLNRKYVDHYRAMIHEAEAKSLSSGEGLTPELQKLQKELSTLNGEQLTAKFYEVDKAGKMTPEKKELFTARKQQIHSERWLRYQNSKYIVRQLVK